VSKQGSTLAGIMDAFAISVSHGLQYGVPLYSFVHAFVGMRFEPAGMTDDPEVRIANSLIDYLFRRLALEYLEPEERAALNIFSVSERSQPTLPGLEDSAIESTSPADAPLCMQCGVGMVRSGSCYVCQECGSTSGCS
jgi:ribonucleoside-diphosphate reductase alpha chain